MSKDSNIDDTIKALQSGQSLTGKDGVDKTTPESSSESGIRATT